MRPADESSPAIPGRLEIACFVAVFAAPFGKRRIGMRVPSGWATWYDVLLNQEGSVVRGPNCEVFDIPRENAESRDRYGRDLIGKSRLRRPRVIQAGERFVTVAGDLAVRGDVCGSWGMRSCPERVMKNHLPPSLDFGFSASLDDMQDRELLVETRIFLAGKMGRTPTFQNRGAQDGGDHWADCFPRLFAGARALPMATPTKDVAYLVSHPVTPAELAATLYESLRSSPALRVREAQGYPVAIVDNRRALHERFG